NLSVSCVAATFMPLTPQNTSEKNKLVELYQYPGYNEHEPTPLPNGTELAEVIEKVVCAQRKSASGKVLCILTKSSKCVLMCVYLHMSGYAMHMYPNREIQGRLFNRIAKNYAALLFDCHKFRYQNALIKVFPSLLSQTLYTCFCSSFPRSWFNTHEFKSQLCNVLSEWMAGTLPVPGSYSNWDYSHLEPERFRREDLLSTKGKQRTGKSTDKIASPPCSSTPSRAQYESLGALHALFFGLSFDIINSLFSFVSSPLQSHPACQGPDFTWHLFNINGHSPLIQHFLQSYNVEPQSGQDILIHRREICKPIPYPYDQLREIRDGKLLLGHILSIPQECRIISYSILLNIFWCWECSHVTQGKKESVNAPSPNPPSYSHAHDPDWPSLGVTSEEECGGRWTGVLSWAQGVQGSAVLSELLQLSGGFLSPGLLGVGVFVQGPLFLVLFVPVQTGLLWPPWFPGSGDCFPFCWPLLLPFHSLSLFSLLCLQLCVST
uniref:Uncharacterized protein n=1 Tax=Terrapene triunguis TaxID=2587831 RepID=A0A674IH93_9SAUR